MSTARGDYRILDEPVSSALYSFAVNPAWPLLAAMLAGSWMSLPWFAFNGVALGSPTRRREIAFVALGVAGAAAIALALVAAHEVGMVPERCVRYVLLVPIVWKLGIAYRLYSLQSRTLQLYEHFGGRVRNGAVLVVFGFFVLRERVVGLFDDPLWQLVAS